MHMKDNLSYFKIIKNEIKQKSLLMSYMYTSSIICTTSSLHHFLISTATSSTNHRDEEISVEPDPRRTISNVLVLCILGESLIAVRSRDIYHFKIH